MKTFIILITSLLLIAHLGAQEPAKAELSSKILVPGESAIFTIIIPNGPADQIPKMPANSKLSFAYSQKGLLNPFNPAMGYGYSYRVTGYEVGSTTIPSIKIQQQGRVYQTPATAITVRPASDIIWSTAKLDKVRPFQYGTSITLPKEAIYLGEIVPVEIKYYFPKSMRAEPSAPVTVPQQDITAWRFEYKKMKGHYRGENGSYDVLSFHSQLSPLKEGKVAIGPTNLDMNIIIEVNSRGRFAKRRIGVNVPSEKKEILSLPLPPGAPSGFQNAVGNFTLEASTTTSSNELGEPLSVMLDVKGQGNLNQLKAPQILNPKGWKVYDTQRQERSEDRKSSEGIVTFTQILRAEQHHDAIPPFSLVYFDPELREYKTLTTPPIPIDIKGSALLPPDSLSPATTSQSQSFLGYIAPQSSISASHSWLRYWQILPATASLLMIFLLWKRYKSHAPNQNRKTSFSATLDELDEMNDRDFLRTASRWIEGSIPSQKRTDSQREILSERDQYCYQPDTTELGKDKRSRYKQTLKALAKTICLVTASLILLPSITKAASLEDAEKAWFDQDYQAAQTVFLELHQQNPQQADLSYNLANCYLHLGHSGLASYYYHLALEAEPTHVESQQNLSFLKQKAHFPQPSLSPAQKLIHSYTKASYRTFLNISLWTGLLSALGFLLARHPLLKIGSATFFSITIITTGLSFWSLTQYVEYGADHPSALKAVFIADESQAIKTSPSRAATDLVTVPAGTSAAILKERGPWYYIELSNRTRGWVEASFLKKLP